jgi:hypothetical protein
MITTPPVSSIALTYTTGADWAVFTSNNPATAGNLQANWTDIASQIDGLYKPVLNSAINEINNVPSVRVYNSTLATATSNTLHTINFDSERYDTNSMHSTSSNASRLTCKQSGTYSIGGNIDWNTNVNGDRQLLIYHNASTIIAATRQNPGISGNCNQSLYTQFYLSSGDYVELVARQTATADISILASPNYSPEFFMNKIG